MWASVLAGLSVAVWMRMPSPRRVRRVAAGPRADGPIDRLRDADLLTSPWIAALGAAIAVTQIFSGELGLVVAAACAVAAYRWVDGLESIGARRRREQLARDLPVGVDLLVAALSAGRPPGQAMAAVAAAVGGPLGTDLAAIAARLELGADPTRVWRDVADDPVLGPVGRSFRRASQSGASVTTVLARCVEDLRRRRHTEANRVARSAGVRTAAPLGLCFLPAFIVVGVVPTVVGAFWHLVL
ncbi:type II secretion system F family protein [Solicola gregarius]|uniref:Type II secretion system F family protein n=1 Tax=Solicola gregarius TaxID=2908642 RepID=A0AA46TF16_9ACTN|nr:type II secretion system F family protein [Solicola gregarius]UYM03368.1 type II secretion system F family protein [Solicola gregarius]